MSQRIGGFAVHRNCHACGFARGNGGNGNGVRRSIAALVVFLAAYALLGEDWRGEWRGGLVSLSFLLGAVEATIVARKGRAVATSWTTFLHAALAVGLIAISLVSARWEWIAFGAILFAALVFVAWPLNDEER